VKKQIMIVEEKTKSELLILTKIYAETVIAETDNTEDENKFKI